MKLETLNDEEEALCLEISDEIMEFFSDKEASLNVIHFSLISSWLSVCKSNDWTKGDFMKVCNFICQVLDE